MRWWQACTKPNRPQIAPEPTTEANAVDLVWAVKLCSLHFATDHLMSGSPGSADGGRPPVLGYAVARLLTLQNAPLPRIQYVTSLA